MFDTFFLTCVKKVSKYSSARQMHARQKCEISTCVHYIHCHSRNHQQSTSLLNRTMVRVKNTANIVRKHASTTAAVVSKSLAKKTKKAVDSAKALIRETKSNGQTLIHTGKLKVPFKPANNKSTSALISAKKGLVKQLKRR